MNKKEILKGLSEVYLQLNETKGKLNTLVSQPIWSQEVSLELDKVVTILQEINDINTVLNDIRKKCFDDTKEIVNTQTKQLITEFTNNTLHLRI